MIALRMIGEGQTPDAYVLGKMIMEYALKYGVHITILIDLLEFPLFFYLYQKDRKYSFFPDMKFQKWTSKKAGYMVLVSVSAAHLGNLFVSILVAVFPRLYSNYDKVNAIEKNAGFGFLFIAAVIVAPILEETIFRGVIYGRARDLFGVKKAMFLSAFLFGLYHMNAVQFLYAGLLGFVLAWLYEVTGSLTGSVFGHMIANAYVTIRGETSSLDWMFNSLIGFVLSTAVFTFLLIVGMHELAQMQSRQENDMFELKL